MNFYYEVYKAIQELTDLEKILDSFIKTDDKEKTKNQVEQCSKVTNAVKNMSDIQAGYKNNVFEESTKEENNVFEK